MEANVIRKDSTLVSTHRAVANDALNTSHLNSQQTSQTAGPDQPPMRKPDLSVGGVNSIRQSHITMKPYQASQIKQNQTEPSNATLTTAATSNSGQPSSSY